MRDLSGRNQLPSLPQNVNASASHISTFQRPIGAPRFLLDENNAGGAAAGGATGAGASGAAAGSGAASGAAAAGAAAGSGAGGDSTAAGGQSGQGAGAGPSPYRPDGLPDHLFGKSDKETIDKLNAAFTGFRTQQSAAGTVPEKPDGYKFEASDKLKPYVANFDKDPVYAKTRDIAHKAGMTDKVFNGFMAPLLESLIEGGLVAAPIDARATLRAMAPAQLANATDAEKETAGARRVQDNIAWADGAKASKAIDEDIAGFLATSAADNPAANKLIEWLRGSNGETIPAMGSGGASGLTDAAMKDRINDPRNNPSSSKFDRTFANETDALSRKHYG